MSFYGHLDAFRYGRHEYGLNTDSCSRALPVVKHAFDGFGDGEVVE